MPFKQKKHPAIRAIAIIAILGGLLTMGRSLMLLQKALEQQRWPSTQVYLEAGKQPRYHVGEKDYLLNASLTQELNTSDQSIVFYNPQAPHKVIFKRPNFWWPLYLSMAGLIVLYAGLHLLRERDRNVESLSFE